MNRRSDGSEERKGQKNRFPSNAFLEIKRNQDIMLVRALAEDKTYAAKAKKLKHLEAKVNKPFSFRINYQILLTLFSHYIVLR